MGGGGTRNGGREKEWGGTRKGGGRRNGEEQGRGVVERGVLVIMHVGTRGWWWGAGRRLSIVVVVGARGVGVVMGRGRYLRVGGMVMGARPCSCCFAVCLRPLLEGDGGCSPSFVSLRCVLAFAVGREWWWVLGPVRLTSLRARVLCWWGMVVGRVASFCGTVVPCHRGCACWWVLLGVLRREGARRRAQLVVVACGRWWWTLVDGDGVLVAVCRQWWWWALRGLVGW